MHDLLQFSLIHTWFSGWRHSLLPAPFAIFVEQSGSMSSQSPFFLCSFSSSGHGGSFSHTTIFWNFPSHSPGWAVAARVSMQNLLFRRCPLPQVVYNRQEARWTWKFGFVGDTYNNNISEIKAVTKEFYFIFPIFIFSR